MIQLRSIALFYMDMLEIPCPYIFTSSVFFTLKQNEKILIIVSMNKSVHKVDYTYIFHPDFKYTVPIYTNIILIPYMSFYNMMWLMLLVVNWK